MFSLIFPSITELKWLYRWAVKRPSPESGIDYNRWRYYAPLLATIVFALPIVAVAWLYELFNPHVATFIVLFCYVAWIPMALKFGYNVSLSWAKWANRKNYERDELTNQLIREASTHKTWKEIERKQGDGTFI